jgi:23S rRNA (guanosine2251-2'-O)-methyltransferase
LDRLYGRNAVFEAFRAARRRIHRLTVAEGARDLELLASSARARRVPLETAQRHQLDRLAQTTHHQGVIAEVDPFPYASLAEVLGAEVPLLLALDSLQDPQNFGTLLRTAFAVGVSGVLIPEHRAVGVTPAVSNASAGAVEHLNVVRVTNLTRSLKELKSRNVWVHGLALEGRAAYWDTDLTGPLVLVVGSEGAGLSRLVRETCDVLVHIPMTPHSTESLNASVAGSLVLYEAFHQRQGIPSQRT